MRTRSYKCLSAHLKNHLKPGMHLALALSGGPDSMALFHLLCEAQSHFDFSLSLLHVDHGLREESRDEADILSKLPFPFYTTRLELSGGNLEDQAREARYAFFEKIRSEIAFDALLLAHQRDDLAETALKRVCEGASLERQYGMSSVSKRGEMVLWRPLLSCKKEELIDYLSDRQHFIDPTNFTNQFLRGRMRET
ncbi:MAG: tRNA lysidine(34) synthetase TilS, partial [Simkaniaceae bacterium]|nr:tRNA lysidine(34) synthetase TilS [Simkaniaceae bacterium]